MFKALAILIIVLGLAVAVAPQFTDCASQGKAATLANGMEMPMKCHWAARSEIATGVPLVVVGALMALGKRRESLRNLSLLGVVLGAFVILLPTIIIGVCGSPMMLCRTVMQPALLALGGLTVVASGAAAFLSHTGRGAKD